MMAFGSTCPSCGSAHAYVGILFVECVKVGCKNYTTRQHQALAEWEDRQHRTNTGEYVHGQTGAGCKRATFDSVLTLAMSRSQVTTPTKHYFVFTKNSKLSIVNVPKDFLVDAHVPVPPGVTDIGLVGNELLANCDTVGLICFDFNAFIWVLRVII